MVDTAQPPRTVLVTGASSFLGGYLVARLAANPYVERVLAVDSRVPRKDLMQAMGRAEFLRIDVRRPTIATAISHYEVDTVVHAATSIVDTAPHSAAIRESTLLGAMAVCDACQRSPSVKRFIVRSTGMVYGAGPRDPSHFAEETPASRQPRHGYGRDLLDVEGYARGLARCRQDIDVTIVRLQAMLGPRASTRMSSYLALPVVPTVIGFAPRLQFLHEEDALAAMEHVTLSGRSGTFNISGDGVLTLAQAIHRAGRIALPVPSGLLAPISGAFQDLWSARLRSSQTDYLTYGRVLDTTRMRAELGFAPRYSTLDTLDDFIARGGLTPVVDAQRWRSLERRVALAAQRLA
ncbi:MAG: NAD-dependent epimerase/dehydratase family protein [Gordonia sp. (in: high G+C Gram-positive bacteria)]